MTRSWLRSLVERARALFGSRRLEAELDEELRFHLEREIEKNVREGLSPAEARRAASLSFGGVDRVKEQVRDETGVRLAHDFLADVRYAYRTLLRSPFFTVVAVLSLALGIGANTAIFTVVNAILVRESPAVAPDRLVNLYRDRARTSADPLNYPDYLEVRERAADVLQDLGGYQFAFVQRDDGMAVRSLTTEMVTGNYFPMLGVVAHLGRTILPEDHVSPGAHPVVMLGHAYWQRAFGGEPEVLGTAVRLSGREFEVVGVAPPSFLGSLRGISPDIYAPIYMARELLPVGGDPIGSRGFNSFNAVGRLLPGASLRQLRERLSSISADLRGTFPGTWQAGDSLVSVATSDVIFNPVVDRFVVPANLLAMGLVSLVLLIACANLASFLLARASDRQAETAMRVALGASRGRLARQHLTEALLLAGAGGLLALWLSRVILDLAMGLTLPMPIPIVLDLAPDGVVFAFTAAAVLVTALLVGVLPALHATRPDVMSIIRDGGRGNARGGTARLGGALVVGQMAVSTVLLVCAGLFLRSLSASSALDVGFGRQPAALLSFVNPSDRIDPAEGRAHTRRVLEGAARLAGVEAVGLIGNLHLNTLNTMFLDVNVDGVAPPPDRSAHWVDFTSVDAGFFEAAGVRIVQGRNFNEADGEDGPAVAIINQAMVDMFWPGESALGRTIRVEVPGWDHPTVVGVATTTKVRRLGETPQPFIYLPYAQEYNAWMTVVARTATQEVAERVAGDLVRTMREVHPEGIVFQANTMADHVGVMLIFRKLSATLSSLFAVVALAMAVMGLYGVVSYTAARRTPEMGIRMSLGARPVDVVRLVVEGGLRLVLVGAALGLVLAVLVSRAAAAFLFGVEPLDPTTFTFGAVVLGVVGFMGAAIPARRAARADPLVALRAR